MLLSSGVQLRSPDRRLQLLAQVADVALEDGLQVVLTVVQILLLQQLP